MTSESTTAHTTVDACDELARRAQRGEDVPERALSTIRPRTLEQVGAPLGTVKAQIHHGRQLTRPLLRGPA